MTHLERIEYLEQQVNTYKNLKEAAEKIVIGLACSSTLKHAQDFGSLLRDAVGMCEIDLEDLQKSYDPEPVRGGIGQYEIGGHGNLIVNP